MAALIHFDRHDEHMAVLTLNRPEARNALSQELLEELNTCLDRIQAMNSIRCVMITGADDKAFSAGADLKERKHMNTEETIQAVGSIGRTVTKVANMPMPVIAAVNGAAFGGGLELALACDIRIVAEHAKLGLTETSLGIIPGAGGTQRLTRLIGAGQAKRLIFTAKRITANEAYKLGMAEAVTTYSALLPEAYNIARTISQNGPIAVKQAKQAINRGEQTDIDTGLAVEQLCYQETMATNDRLEGLQAFKEKRQPNYQGN